MRCRMALRWAVRCRYEIVKFVMTRWLTRGLCYQLPRDEGYARRESFLKSPEVPKDGEDTIEKTNYESLMELKKYQYAQTDAESIISYPSVIDMDYICDYESDTVMMEEIMKYVEVCWQHHWPCRRIRALAKKPRYKWEIDGHAIHEGKVELMKVETFWVFTKKSYKWPPPPREQELKVYEWNLDIRDHSIE